MKDVAPRMLLVGSTLFVLAGCGKPTGTVTGIVSQKGKAVNGGLVVLLSETGMKIQARIKPDGSYRASQVPVGTAKVAVALGGPAGLPSIVVPRLPSHLQADPHKTPGTSFSNPDRSGLVCQVSSGDQVYNIDLP